MLAALPFALGRLARAAVARAPFVACALAPALLLGSCATPRLRVVGIEVARGATFDLLPPAALGQELALEQRVESRHGEQRHAFHCLLEVDRERLVLVGMTPFHTRAFTLILSEQELDLEMAPGAQLPAEPSRILADLQLALWPAPTARGLTRREHGPADPARVPAGTASFARERSFSRGAEPVLVVRYESADPAAPWAGRIVIENREQAYALEVRTLRAEKLGP